MKKINMKRLADRQLEEIIEAGEMFKQKKISYAQASEVHSRSREICRILGLRNRIATAAKKEPCQDLLEYAGLETENDSST